jgi:hypothetical protein
VLIEFFLTEPWGVAPGSYEYRAVGAKHIPARDVKNGAEGALFLASSSPSDESVQSAGKASCSVELTARRGLLDPPDLPKIDISTYRKP